MAWLVGNVRAQTSPRDAARALNNSVCCSREGERWPEMSQGCYQGLTSPHEPGEATRSSWLGERQFWFLFSGLEGVPGQAASAVRSPAPSQTGGEEKLFGWSCVSEHSQVGLH